jgi:hypothetical protein
MPASGTGSTPATAATPRTGPARKDPTLVTEAAALRPGRALDVGCGEGADAIWLAEHGWQVTAIDPSIIALRRARTTAHASGVSPRPIAGTGSPPPYWTGYEPPSVGRVGSRPTPSPRTGKAMAATSEAPRSMYDERNFETGEGPCARHRRTSPRLTWRGPATTSRPMRAPTQAATPHASSSRQRRLVSAMQGQLRAWGATHRYPLEHCRR